MAALRTDPARFEVVKNALYAAAEEMKIVLAKTAYSPLLKVAGDYSCGIFDTAGNMVAQGPDLPIHLGSMPDAVRAIVRAFPDAAPGDVFIHNDPYQGGSHLPDVNVVAPAFHDGTIARLRLRACALAGHRQRHARQLRRGHRNLRRGPAYPAGPPVSRRQTGSRRSRRSSSPMCARQPNGSATCARRSRRTGGRRSGWPRWRRNTAPIRCCKSCRRCWTTPKRMMRAALRALPDGEAEFSDVFDGDGVIADGRYRGRRPSPSSCASANAATRITADFTGSDPPVAGPMNAPLTVTASGVFCALKMIADPKSLIPPNSGCWRPVTVTAPPGSRGERAASLTGGLCQPRNVASRSPTW